MVLQVFVERGRNRELEHVFDFIPSKGIMPRPGDTVDDLDGKVWSIVRYHFGTGGIPILIIRPRDGGLVLA